jgi:hypothetical protein
MQRQRARIIGLGLLLAVSACKEDRLVGERCPSPHLPDGGATLARGAVESGFYGTSCAPCEGDRIRLDDRGCPIYVTFESCGGDVCVGGVPVSRGLPDAGARADADIDEDGGAIEEDAGTSEEEDAGAD